MCGAGKCALLIAEEFALQQRFGDGRAIDRYEGLAIARAALMNGAGDQLFASSTLAQQENRGVTGCNFANKLVDLMHARTLTYHRMLQIHLFPQPLVFLFKPLQVARIFQHGCGDRRYDHQHVQVAGVEANV